MSTIVVTIKTNKDADIFKKAGQKNANTNRLQALIAGLNSGAFIGELYVQGSSTDPVAASATATLVSCATDTITVGKTTFTGTGTPTTALHFETDGDDTADAAALAAAINAHTDASKLVSATSAVNVVTITALQRGLLGNHIALSETGTTIVCTGSGFLAGGTGGATNAAEQLR